MYYYMAEKAEKKKKLFKFCSVAPNGRQMETYVTQVSIKKN